MAKKKSGKHYVSKGERPNVTRSLLKKPGYNDSMERLINVRKAYDAGKPISDKTLLAFGPRNSGEQARYQGLKKAER